MTDRELLELAAKAAGMRVELVWFCTPFLDEWQGLREIGCNGNSDEHEWNPLNDDGDALRLAVKLGLVVCVLNEISRTGIYLPAEHVGGKYDVVECHESDPCAATRRAIVLAAAEIGKSMP